MSLSNITNKSGLIPSSKISTLAGVNEDIQLNLGTIGQVTSADIGISVTNPTGPSVVLSSTGIPCAIANYCASINGVSSNGVEQFISFDTLISETTGYFTHTALPTPFNSFNVTQAGNYKITFNITLQASAGGPATGYAYIKLGGIVQSSSVIIQSMDTASGYHSITGTFFQNISPSENIQLCYKAKTGTITPYADSSKQGTPPCASIVIQLQP